MNVIEEVCPLIISIWLTLVMMTQNAQTPMDLTTAHVWRVILEAEEIVVVRPERLFVKIFPFITILDDTRDQSVIYASIIMPQII